MLARAAQLNRAVPALVHLCRPSQHLAAAAARGSAPARRLSVITNVATPEAPQKKGSEGQAASFASSAAVAGIPYADLTIGARPKRWRAGRGPGAGVAARPSAAVELAATAQPRRSHPAFPLTCMPPLPTPRRRASRDVRQ